MFTSQVFRQEIDDLFAVVGPMLSALLMFDDAAANFPVGCRQNTVDPASDRAAGGVQQFRNAGQQIVIPRILNQTFPTKVPVAWALAHAEALSFEKRGL